LSDVCPAGALSAVVVAGGATEPEGVGRMALARIGVGVELYRRAVRPPADHLRRQLLWRRRRIGTGHAGSDLAAEAGNVLAESAEHQEGTVLPQRILGGHTARGVGVAEHELASG